MRVRDILSKVPKFIWIEILGFELTSNKTVGYAFEILKSNCDVLDKEVLFMEPGDKHMRILINARYGSRFDEEGE